MIKKILIAIFLIFFVPINSFSKAPPLGTGSLVPANIMIMLDNSGSMGWDLAGAQLSSATSFLNGPTDVETDSAGDVYVFQPYNSYFEGKNYRIHVFGSDGTFKRRMLEYKYNYWNPICGKVGKPTFKFAMHNDQIYYFDGNDYRIKISVINKSSGQCIRQSGNIDTPRYGGHQSSFSAIAVSDKYIYLGQGNCKFFCYGSGYPHHRSSSGTITILRRSDFSFVNKIN